MARMATEKRISSITKSQAPGIKPTKGIKALKAATTLFGSKAIRKLRKVIDKVGDEDAIPEPENRTFRGGFQDSAKTCEKYVEDADPLVEAIKIHQNFAKRLGHEECPILAEALRDANKRKEWVAQYGDKRGTAKLVLADEEESSNYGEDDTASIDDQLTAEDYKLDIHGGASRACGVDQSWTVLAEDEDDESPFSLCGTPYSASASASDSTLQLSDFAHSTPRKSTSTSHSLGSAVEKVPQAWLDAPISTPRSTASRASSLAHVAKQHEAEWKAKTTLPRHTSLNAQPGTAFDSAVDLAPGKYVPARASWGSCTPKLNDWNSLPFQRRAATFPAASPSNPS